MNIAKTIGHYQITDEELGVGGVGAVYKAIRHYGGLERQDTVACKVIRHEFSRNQAHEAMLCEEAFLAIKLAHPNLVRVFDCFREDGRMYLMMEYIDGVSLDELVSAHRSLPESAVAHVVHSVAQALAYLHDEDILHRDIAPPNVLISRDGRVKISDFGIAQTTSTDGEGTHTFHGRPAFTCPACIDTEQHTKLSDLWALFITAFYAASGILPYGPDSNASAPLLALDEVWQRAVSQEIAIPDEPFSPNFETLVRDLLKPSPTGRRFRRAAEVAAFVEEQFSLRPGKDELMRLIEARDGASTARTIDQQQPVPRRAQRTSMRQRLPDTVTDPPRSLAIITRRKSLLFSMIVLGFIGTGVALDMLASDTPLPKNSDNALTIDELADGACYADHRPTELISHAPIVPIAANRGSETHLPGRKTSARSWKPRGRGMKVPVNDGVPLPIPP